MSDVATEEKAAPDPELEELFSAGLHFAYARTRRHPRMLPFIAGVKSNIEVFHADKIRDQLLSALGFIESLGSSGDTILWVGTKPSAALAVRDVAEALGHPYVDTRWLGGTLTNFKIIRERISYWEDLIAKQKSGELGKYTKQEQIRIQKDIERMARGFHGIAKLTAMPQAIFIVDSKEEANALREARQKRVPVIALINSDCDPENITHPIPGNDNSSKSIRYVLEKARDAYLAGKKLSAQKNNGHENA
ncbi:MAG: 30S ribosomal protein S2 [Candidatus Ryanbacteria bacterium]|nr:30S ribosomal protein S2 [Candidatus Ryanbacteria bacterium]